MAGNAGNPATSSQTTVRTSVVPSPAVMAIHVQPGRSPNRAAAARKSAKKSTSGGPRSANESSPGTRKPKASSSKRPGFSETTYSVGPRQTDTMSTHGTTTATSSTHHSSSKTERNQKPRAVSAASFARSKSVSAPAARSSSARAPSAMPTARSPRASRHGSANQTNAKTAGITKTAMKSTSHVVDISGS